MVVAAMSSMMVRMSVRGRPSPVHRDEAEQAVLDLVPLGGAGRVVADGDLEAGLGRELGEVPFPGSEPVAVGAAGIGGDHQPGRVREPGLAERVPPAADRLDRELGGVGGVAHVDPAFVVGDVVDPIGDGLGVLAQGPVGEVVHVHPLGFTARLPFGAAVGVVADQLLLFGVDRDHRITRRQPLAASALRWLNWPSRSGWALPSFCFAGACNE